MKKTILKKIMKKTLITSISMILVAFVFFGMGIIKVSAEEPEEPVLQEELTQTLETESDATDTEVIVIENANEIKADEIAEDNPEATELEANEDETAIDVNDNDIAVDDADTVDLVPNDEEAKDGDIEEIPVITLDAVSETYTFEENGVSLGDYIDYEVNQAQNSMYYASSMAGDKLSGNNRVIYNKLKKMAIDIANGDRNDSICKISLSELGLNKGYTASDLGLSSSQSKDTMAGFNAMLNVVNYKSIDDKLILNALRADCPFEGYWMGLSCSHAVGRRVELNETSGYKWYFEGDFIFQISVSKDYRGNNEYAVNTTKTKAVKTTINNINSIISEANNKNDSEKIQFYKDKICALTDYNKDALKLSDSNYGNPWQLVYVFDGDKNTNVVCEGYSKAFDYLCEKTTFSDSSINCYSVTGLLGNEAHMWNIVHWSDKANYLVDVTSCDTNNTNDLFMAAPISGTVDKGYYFMVSSNYSFSYKYDDAARHLFSNNELTIGNNAVLTGISIEYNSNIQSRMNTSFTVKKEGGSYSCLYKLDYVEDEKGNKIVVYATDYSSQNVFNITFPKGGKYTIKFSAKDGSKEVSKAISVNVKMGESEQVEAFVERFYTQILDRPSEPDGLRNWTTALLAGTRGGADVADEFIHSKEYSLKNDSDDVYITKLYLAFFDRKPDKEGFESWKNYLASGHTRDDVLYGFLVSDEYKILCANYGIRRDSTRTFTKRFYKLILGRKDDQITADELDNWQKALDAKTITGSDMTREWINRTPEFQNRKLNNDEFIRVLYKVVFNRDVDPSGLATWTGKLNSGKTRAQVLEEIIAQPEFSNMCAEYGIRP